MPDRTAPNEHEIGYAYPSSPSAVKCGFARRGCYTVKVGKSERGVATLAQARQHANELGTSPGRWSIDHRLNGAGGG